MNGFNTNDDLLVHLLSNGSDEWSTPTDIDTVCAENLFNLNKLEEDDSSVERPRAQMDGGAKCSVTNEIKLLKRVTWYSKKFPARVKFKGATSNERIVPEAVGYLQVPTIDPGKSIDVKCYYSPRFTSPFSLIMMFWNPTLIENNTVDNP